MSRRDLAVLGAAACVACCVAPVLGALGVIAALGVAGAWVFGVASLVVAVAVAVVLIHARRRGARRPMCTTAATPVAITRKRDTSHATK
jgi:hypothetical protein